MNKKGQLSLQILIYGAIAIIILAGILIWMDANVNAVLRYQNRSVAFNIAEAGLEYYRWHLAHAPKDFTDGTGGPGPYAHNYYDKNGDLLGQFILEITPPLVGSSIVAIKSTGKVSTDPSIEKIIKAKLGIPSFAKYAVVLNDNVRFGAGTQIYGLVHSNNGIRFDGVAAYNLVTSALASYDDPDHSGVNEFGVHTHIAPVDPLPPNPVPVRSDIFKAGRNFPVPAVDFVGITQTLSQIKENASSSGFYRGPSGSGRFGYDVVLKTNDNFDLYAVTALAAPPNGCVNNSNQDGWGGWSIKTETLLGNYPIPANGLIFLEDDVWVRGQINSARLTIGSARFPDNPATRSNITVNENLLYTNYDGQDVIGLIAQKNFNIGLYSQDTLRIDAALIAQYGRVGRYYYRPPSQSDKTQSRCSPYHNRNAVTAYGMIASNQRYGFAYIDYEGLHTGYQIRNLIYDANLLYNPPPSFPLTTEPYQVLSWEEIK